MKKSRISLLFLFVLLTGVVLVGCNSSKTDPSAGKEKHANILPGDKVYADVNEEAFRGQGKLAFVSEGTLYVLNGKNNTINRINVNGIALNPMLSSDGNFLAFISIDNADKTNGNLWLAKSDGTDVIKVKGLTGPIENGSFSWSPKGNTLAVCAEGGTYLVDTQGKASNLIKSNDYISVVWSPDGKFLAYNLTLPYDKNRPDLRSDALCTIDTNSGKTVKHLTSPQAGINAVAWWPDGKGILYWVDPCHSASIAADGLDLYSLALGNNNPTKLPTGLPYPEYLAHLSPNQLIMVVGSGREIYTNKSLALVSVINGSSSKLPQPQNSVASDLALSPDVRYLSYVSARDLGRNFDFKTYKVEDWFKAHFLWVSNADGSEARELKAAGGDVSLPQWSKDGKKIIYLKDNCVWIIDAVGKYPYKITNLSLEKADPNNAELRVDLNSLFSWCK